MNDEFISVFSEFLAILNTEAMMWSLSPLTHKKFNKTQSTFNHFSVSLYFNDFLILREKYPENFRFEGWMYENKSFMPYFYYDSKKVHISLIIPTNIDQFTEKLTKINKIRLCYWGNNHKSLLLKIKGSRTKHIDIDELIDLFYIKKNTQFIITEDSIYNFTVWNNLNWNNMNYFEIQNIRFQYFNEFEKYLNFINIS
ncbi:hypothetical protein NXS15_00405 [Mycoplasma sp. CSL7475-4]|uniref:hypothetical protein n=1 Tax=Mycoplasma sp. CSL7475-4 TaxID=2973942 RepID=UPI00216B35CD|nr:hypothetical protein [Mycoplasma sp. CSL7475-4]MCS4536593.1 hypothetical protein [Mycoplasma sp. CSL7475-4]